MGTLFWKKASTELTILSTYKQIIRWRVTFPYFSGHLTGGLDCNLPSKS